LNKPEPDEEYKPKSDLSALVDAALSIEKVRVRTQGRQSHLKLDGRVDPETDKLLERLVEIEGWVDGRVANLITSHPAYEWFSRVKGVGRENIGKVVSPVDIERAGTISALWKFSGFGVKYGKAPRREKGGGKLEYNSHLRSMCWRLANSLMRAKGCFYDYYVAQKDRYAESYQARGIKIIPAAKLPKKDGKQYEPEDMISEGHVHNQALRKMIKLFLSCLWLTWREAEGLPISKPYAIDQLKHESFIDPWTMVDKPKPKAISRK